MISSEKYSDDGGEERKKKTTLQSPDPKYLE
jgi:hypothetical protein